MYKNFFEMENKPFTRSIPVDRLYVSPQLENARGRIHYAADEGLFVVVTAEPGCGKSTLIRMVKHTLPAEKYMLLYLADSKLTPRWMYAGFLDQMDLEPNFYRGDSKRKLQKAIEKTRVEDGKKVICVLDEAHLLEKETVEEFRFLLNCNFDSESPMSLVLVGQPELWSQKLRLKKYVAVKQRIDINITLGRLDRAGVQKYIAAHLAYSGCTKELFTSDAEDVVYKVSGGIPRLVNRVCDNSLLYAYQNQKRLVDGHMVQFVSDNEMVGGEDL